MFEAGRLGNVALCIAWVCWATAATIVVAGDVFFPSFNCYPPCKTAYGETQTLQQAIGLFRIDNDRCPRSLGELNVGKYILKDAVDPWGIPYSFRCPGAWNPDAADVWSFGHDRREDTADDVGSWQRYQDQCRY